MIISVSDLKSKLNVNNVTDEVLQDKLEALEYLIRKYTNNNFQDRNIRFRCDIVDGKIEGSSILLNENDTIEINKSKYNDGVYSIKEINDNIVLNESLIDENDVLVTKVKYPKDIVVGVVNLLEWDIKNRNKIGIASETISRHSVTYFNMDGDNSLMGYPKALFGFLNPYKKARF